MVEEAYESGLSKAMKFYPAGATTNSDSGVTDFRNIEPAIRVMIDKKIPLLIHGEVTDSDVDMFDRESRFIDEILIPFREEFPELKIVMEHISTKDAVQYVTDSSDTMAASITPHHIRFNRTALFNGGLQPHNYCLPILKSESDRVAVLDAATSGNPKFFLGTDSAPHLRVNKEKSGAAAGLYNGYNSLALYAESFDAIGRLDRLEAFASFYGADFYGIERNSGTITLVKENDEIPTSIPTEDGEIVPFLAGNSCRWRVE
jgi:dihydroorotase